MIPEAGLSLIPVAEELNPSGERADAPAIGNTAHRLQLPLIFNNFNPALYVKVPLLAGLTQAEAEAALQAAQLAAGNITQGSSPFVPAGKVMGQNPGAGCYVLPGSTVDLILSTGPALVQVPGTGDLNQADAEAAILAAGLTVGNITQETSLTVLAGKVIRQTPAAGTWVLEGTAVDLVVSLGPVLATVPDVVNKTQAEAETLLAASGLVVGNITTANHETIPAGSVISQNPTAGTSVPQNAPVDLVLSLGPAGPTLPPDPSLVAPKLNLTVATDVYSATRFLYSGTNPIQTGVEEGTIQFQRAAVVRGKALDRQGNALPWVTITVLNHPEFGQTVSRADGMFDLAVNGGGVLVINCALAGHLGVQRQVQVPWQDYVVLPDVILVPLDPNVTAVDLNEPGIKVARGSLSSDADGVRRATLLFPEGITAGIILADGSSQPITSLNVRATEFTVGPNGPQAMPGALPPNVAYTYAVEFTVDEALALGGREVRFSAPVIHYLENFLNFPVGEVVPAGYYDRTLGQWIPSSSGKVIKILDTAGGLVLIDTDGDDEADDLLGISNAERAQLALLYSAGQTLWRVPIPHFTPWDENWALRLPADAVSPQQPVPEEKPCEECCEVNGSIVECQTQVLREQIPVTGTPFRLHYTSERALGRQAVFKIPLSGDTPPASLIRIDVNVTVAGRLFSTSFTPAPNLTHTFIWDGKDVYGRYVQGAQRLFVRIGYVYDAVYVRTGAFSANGGGAFTGPDIVTRGETILWQEMELPTYRLDGLAQGFRGLDTERPPRLRRRGSDGVSRGRKTPERRSPERSECHSNGGRQRRDRFGG
jgi:beta-lactam-binding protein with PASTA domain